MLEKSFSLLFYLKKPKKYIVGPMPVYLRITVDGIPKEISTKRFCEPDRWNISSQCAKGTREYTRSLNSFIAALARQVHDARTKLIEGGIRFTAADLKNAITGQSDRPKMLLEIFQEHNNELKVLVGKEYAQGTLQRYKISLEHTRAFIKWKYNCDDIDMRKLEPEFIASYEFWLKSVRSCNHNTTMKYLANFRKIINRCIQNGWLVKNPFMGYKMTKREVNRMALTKEELSLITNKEFTINRLSQVRDIFVFCCYTGLAYADVLKLKKSEIAIGLDGEKWIFTKRRKTDTASRIPLLPTALKILARYHDYPLKDNSALPVTSNQKMNAYLKEIIDLCGIHKTLTFHIARHTFATTVTLNNGVPIETVSKMLGHTNLKTTQLYAKILDGKISGDMQNLREKLSNV